MNDEFTKAPSGLWLPGSIPNPVVERAEFETKVQGFTPAPAEDRKRGGGQWRGGDSRRRRMVAFMDK